MKLAFPYMASVPALSKLMELLGHEVIRPDKPSQGTMDLGVKYSPEFICIPFKVITGTYIECAERGAEIIITSGGCGPCRAGLYGEIHSKILKKMGYDTEVLVFDSMFKDFKAFWRKVQIVRNKTPYHRLIRISVLTVKMIKQMDDMQKKIKQLRAYEAKKGDFTKAWSKIEKMYLQCNTLKQLKAVKKQAWDMINAVPVNIANEEEKIRVGICGEIFVVMESFTNLEIEKRLNDLGCEVENPQYISDWLVHNTLPSWINRSHSKKVEDKGRKYTALNCGGHDLENMGLMVDYAERGFDAVVHLQPFGCLPELVTRSIMPGISEDLDMPILTLSLDEQSGEANSQTRLEAFIELVRSKKIKVGEHEHIEELDEVNNAAKWKEAVQNT